MPKRESHLSDKVPWRVPIAPGVLVHKQTHALQRTYRLRGRDLTGETKESRGSMVLAANDVLKRPGGGWTIHGEMRRVRITEYEVSTFTNPVAWLIDEDRRDYLLVNPGSRETEYYLTLTWKPASRSAQRWGQWLLTGPKGRSDATADERWRAASLQTFLDQSAHLMSLLRSVITIGPGHRAEPLTTDETLTYLRTTVSDDWHQLSCPLLPVDIDVLLCNRDYTGGWYPYWGVPPGQPGERDDRTHLRIASITGYPSASLVGVTEGLEAKDIDFSLVVRWIAEDRHLQGKLLRQTEKAWAGEEKSFGDQISQNLTGQSPRVSNVEAMMKAEQVQAARREMGAEVIAYGQFGCTLKTWDHDATVATEKLRELMRVLEGQGFALRVEREHATPAWLSTHPGNRVDGVRKTPQKSLFLAHMLPGLSAAYMGPARDEHLQGPPWFAVHRDGTTLMRIVNHVQDNGHIKIIGPTRSGKSVLLAFMVASWFRYPGAQVFWFDLDRSARCLTYCLGGHWYDLGSTAMGIQPFRRVDDVAQRAWLRSWLIRDLARYGVKLSEDVSGTLRDGLERLAQAPARQRTFTEFIYILTSLMRVSESASRNRHSPYFTRMRALVKTQAQVVKALDEYAGGILDADHDDLQDGPLHTFEQKSLLAEPRLVPMTMEWLFHELESRFDTRHPTFIPMDDAAVTWALPDIEKNGKKWLTTVAKRNVSLGFTTHSLTQVFESDLGSLLIESTAQTFAMANPQASAPRIAAIYEQMGYNPEEINLISRMPPQRDCYWSAPLLGKARFSLELSPFLLSMFARNREEDHEAMDRILATDGREGFAPAWFRHAGFPAQAAAVERWQAEKGVSDAAD